MITKMRDTIFCPVLPSAVLVPSLAQYTNLTLNLSPLMTSSFIATNSGISPAKKYKSANTLSDLNREYP